MAFFYSGKNNHLKNSTTPAYQFEIFINVTIADKLFWLYSMRIVFCELFYRY
jgi:hypothetical protein